MPRSARARPRDLTPGWPDTPSPDDIAEVARRFAVNLREALEGHSTRVGAKLAGTNHVTLIHILDGSSWPDLETIAKIEKALGEDLWPGRVEG